MSEGPSPSHSGIAAGGGGSALTPESLDALLADFRAWLTPWTEAVPPAEAAVPAPAPDLFTLLSGFTALRQEVNLQTRAARTQAEHTAEALRRLGEAVDETRAARDSAPDRAAEAADAALRPLLKGVVDVYDALALAGREVERAADAVGSVPDPVEEGDELPEPPPDPPLVPVSRGWAAWLGRPTPSMPTSEPWRDYAVTLRTRLEADRAFRREAAATASAGLHRAREVMSALAGGYRMGLRRLERVLEQAGVAPMNAAGRTFDPETMEAVEVVTAGEGRPAGVVVEEVRRGWLWRGRVFRFAQVRVAGG